jgi:isopentenyldiphosphate isomerase
MDEYIDILNEQGKVSGNVCLKSEAHKNGLFHQSVHIWIVDFNTNVLIQKRAANKDVFPNLWDVSVAGHISAGELPISSAIREVKEEIGLSIINKNLHFIGNFTKKIHHQPNLIDFELHHIYICKVLFDFSSLKIQQEEVAALKIMPLHYLINDIKKNKNQYVPHGNKYYNLVFNALKKN